MNWQMIVFALAVGLGIWFFVLPKGERGYEVRSLSAKELTESKAVVVDIRRPDEWRATGVIKGAKLVTFTSAEALLSAIGPLRDDQPLVLICHSGRRSAAAASAMVGKVKGPIISYDGGMSAWIAAKGQITKPAL